MTKLERAVADLVDELLPRGSVLDRARLAADIAAAADRLSRSEVARAKEQGATWADVGEAFGVATQTAHERFRSGPDGLHSRYEFR